MLRILAASITTITLIATAQAAIAAPVLRQSVTVQTPIVTVGDLFDDAGPHAGDGLFRSPAPGTAGQVSIEAIRTAMTKIGLGDFDNPGFIEVRVARDGTAVTLDLLDGLVAEELKTRGDLPGAMSVDIRPDHNLGTLFAGAGDQPVILEDLRYLNGSNRFSARFMLAGQTQPLNLGGTIQFSVEAPYLTRSLSTGSVIGADDIQMRPVAVQFADNSGVLTAGEVVGKEVTRQMREGIIVRPADIADPLVIARNDQVTLLLRSGPMTLTVRGQALSDASLGQSVSVLNAVSNKVVRGIASGSGTVEVSMAAEKVASL